LDTTKSANTDQTIQAKPSHAGELASQHAGRAKLPEPASQVGEQAI